MTRLSPAFMLIPALLCATTSAVAESAKAPTFLAETDRTVAGGRGVQFVLAQTEIEPTIDLGRIASNVGGGGLIGALIIEASDNRREIMTRTAQQNAEATVAPLRSALLGFDVDTVALRATRAALEKVSWFQADSVMPSKDPSAKARSAFLESAGTPQAALVRYAYELSPDFSQIRVIADISIVRRPQLEGKGSTDPAPVLFQARVVDVVQLRVRSYEAHDNVASWSAANGKLARAALTGAFAAFETSIPAALNLTAPAVRALNAKGHEKVFAAGFYGPLVARDGDGSDGVLLWSAGLVHVSSIS